MVFAYETHPAWINPRRICSASVNPTSPRFLKPLLLSYCAAQFDRKPFYVWFILAPVHNHELIQLFRFHDSMLPFFILIISWFSQTGMRCFWTKPPSALGPAAKFLWILCLQVFFPLWSEVAHLMWMMAAVREPLACVTSAMVSCCCSVQQQVLRLCSTPVSMSTCG